jgi:hypothetical protein
MKMNLTKLLTAGLVLVAGTAAAQTYNSTIVDGVFVARANAVSTSVPAGVNINPSNNRPVRIFTRGSVASSATITTELADGTVLDSRTVAVGTTSAEAVSFTVPFFQVLRTSVTTALTGTQGVSITVIQ